MLEICFKAIHDSFFKRIDRLLNLAPEQHFQSYLCNRNYARYACQAFILYTLKWCTCDFGRRDARYSNIFKIGSLYKTKNARARVCCRC